jgi:hypothetical protein
VSEDGMSAIGEKDGNPTTIDFYEPITPLAKRRHEEMAVLAN